jgi:hypothetical protein
MRCDLCGFKLMSEETRYVEGTVCSDSAGCRRRALMRMREIRKLYRELDYRIAHRASTSETSRFVHGRLTEILA